jgi:hypothetical protein
VSHQFDRAKLFASAKPIFGSYNGKQGVIEGLDAILDAFEKENFPKDQEAYMLATAAWESARTMQPVRETLASTDAEAVRRLDYAWSRGRLPWVKTPYWRKDARGQSWFGRGLVQITHKFNYEKLGKAIGVDLVSNPSLALNMPVAIKIMVTGMKNGLFTGAKLSQFLDGIDESDVEDYREFKAARKIINGTDKDDEIAEFALIFEKGIRYV